ncbi:tRNA1(Val) A37 N6-methylase TrmN6 [Roseovarius litoreus]|uniref:tRNA1(Val) A37 N6-methylase TrmN6 n=1 Tax=Roseovarius litoreus TaxID=1155722 RepID=A0A1M7AHM4_9RHOB|nr:methyltransferase [Roseovarius litoreus]SHL42231.1 tRNA1(Val) A37 N6-methylase TrmN6 [Roseovarius litoreus]
MADHWPEGSLTTDDFLGGRLRISQPRDGYRAGVDPVLLAASVPARPGDSVLDLGCGVGVAGLCLASRVEGLMLAGLELQCGYAALARQNALANGITMEVVTGDVSDMPEQFRRRQFTHVLVNPPYFDRNAGSAARDTGRETALGEVTPLATWIRAAARRAAPKGTVTFIHRTERLPALLGEISDHLGSLEVLPLIPRRGRPARLALVRGRKGGRADFKLHDGWVLHEGAAHVSDKENYTDATACVLREGGHLPFQL